MRRPNGASPDAPPSERSAARDRDRFPRYRDRVTQWRTPWKIGYLRPGTPLPRRLPDPLLEGRQTGRCAGVARSWNRGHGSSPIRAPQAGAEADRASSRAEHSCHPGDAGNEAARGNWRKVPHVREIDRAHVRTHQNRGALPGTRSTLRAQRSAVEPGPGGHEESVSPRDPAPARRSSGTREANEAEDSIRRSAR